ncbi:MAG: MBL fold metallo-hydrolase [Verrucomicrobiae bacterium]|nr:MBL fold metallo-hydrolase [Verrucomicrobiae bacterium]
MRIKIWGCRGSITTPGPTTLRYGGNSTCVEIRTAEGEANGQTIIVDAGSGVRPLGKALRREKKIFRIRFFFSHSHWDHLVGFPFFEPAYFPDYHITFCGGPHAQDSIKRYLSRQMEAPFFPVDFSLLKAQFDFRCERAHQDPGPCLFDGMEASSAPLSHPNGGYGFKFVHNGKVFVLFTDNELSFQHEGGLNRAGYVEFCSGADLLIHDAQYTDAEYTTTRGWGHSTYADTVDLAIAAGVRRLGLFHHDPDRTDDDLDRQVESCRERIRAAGSKVECFACAEGMTLEV